MIKVILLLLISILVVSSITIKLNDFDQDGKEIQQVEGQQPTELLPPTEELQQPNPLNNKQKSMFQKVLHKFQLTKTKKDQFGNPIFENGKKVRVFKNPLSMFTKKKYDVNGKPVVNQKGQNVRILKNPFGFFGRNKAQTVNQPGSNIDQTTTDEIPAGPVEDAVGY